MSFFPPSTDPSSGTVDADMPIVETQHRQQRRQGQLDGFLDGAWSQNDSFWPDSMMTGSTHPQHLCEASVKTGEASELSEGTFNATSVQSWPTRATGSSSKRRGKKKTRNDFERLAFFQAKEEQQQDEEFRAQHEAQVQSDCANDVPHCTNEPTPANSMIASMTFPLPNDQAELYTTKSSKLSTESLQQSLNGMLQNESMGENQPPNSARLSPATVQTAGQSSLADSPASQAEKQSLDPPTQQSSVSNVQKVADLCGEMMREFLHLHGHEDEHAEEISSEFKEYVFSTRTTQVLELLQELQNEARKQAETRPLPPQRSGAKKVEGTAPAKSDGARVVLERGDCVEMDFPEVKWEDSVNFADDSSEDDAKSVNMPAPIKPEITRRAFSADADMLGNSARSLQKQQIEEVEEEESLSSEEIKKKEAEESEEGTKKQRPSLPREESFAPDMNWDPASESNRELHSASEAFDLMAGNDSFSHPRSKSMGHGVDDLCANGAERSSSRFMLKVENRSSRQRGVDAPIAPVKRTVDKENSPLKRQSGSKKIDVSEIEGSVPCLPSIKNLRAPRRNSTSFEIDVVQWNSSMDFSNRGVNGNDEDGAKKSPHSVVDTLDSDCTESRSRHGSITVRRGSYLDKVLQEAQLKRIFGSADKEAENEERAHTGQPGTNDESELEGTLDEEANPAAEKERIRSKSADLEQLCVKDKESETDDLMKKFGASDGALLNRSTDEESDLFASTWEDFGKTASPSGVDSFALQSETVKKEKDENDEDSSVESGGEDNVPAYMQGSGGLPNPKLNDETGPESQPDVTGAPSDDGFGSSSSAFPPVSTDDAFSPHQFPNSSPEDDGFFSSAQDAFTSFPKDGAFESAKDKEGAVLGFGTNDDFDMDAFSSGTSAFFSVDDPFKSSDKGDKSKSGSETTSDGFFSAADGFHSPSPVGGEASKATVSSGPDPFFSNESTTEDPFFGQDVNFDEKSTDEFASDDFQGPAPTSDDARTTPGLQSVDEQSDLFTDPDQDRKRASSASSAVENNGPPTDVQKSDGKAPRSNSMDGQEGLETMTFTTSSSNFTSSTRDPSFTHTSVSTGAGSFPTVSSAPTPSSSQRRGWQRPNRSMPYNHDESMSDGAVLYSFPIKGGKHQNGGAGGNESMDWETSTFQHRRFRRPSQSDDDSSVEDMDDSGDSFSVMARNESFVRRKKIPTPTRRASISSSSTPNFQHRPPRPRGSISSGMSSTSPRQSSPRRLLHDQQKGNELGETPTPTMPSRPYGNRRSSENFVSSSQDDRRRDYNNSNSERSVGDTPRLPVRTNSRQASSPPPGPIQKPNSRHASPIPPSQSESQSSGSALPSPTPEEEGQKRPLMLDGTDISNLVSLGGERRRSSLGATSRDDSVKSTSQLSLTSSEEINGFLRRLREDTERNKQRVSRLRSSTGTLYSLASLESETKDSSHSQS